MENLKRSFKTVPSQIQSISLDEQLLFFFSDFFHDGEIMCEIGVGEGNFAELMAYIGRFQRKKLLLVDNYCDYGKLSKKA